MNKHTIDMTRKTLRHIERAQQHAHDPSRWKQVVADLAAARAVLARLRAEMGADPPEHVATAVDLTPPLFTDLGDG